MVLVEYFDSLFIVIYFPSIPDFGIHSVFVLSGQFFSFSTLLPDDPYIIKRIVEFQSKIIVNVFVPEQQSTPCRSSFEVDVDFKESIRTIKLLMK
jgi:hypothetical protein